ncbi:MAG: IPT/TIG domain-containing protein [Candidatus Levybacteria bacterium]|nr:IPT/TIG domain-containing protein [Candidatus Levybacteria bacterium]
MDPNQQAQSIQPETFLKPDLPQPINEIPSSRNKLKLILLIITLLVIVGLGTYYLSVKQNKLNQQVTITPTVAQLSPTLIETNTQQKNIKISPSVPSIKPSNTPIPPTSTTAPTAIPLGIYMHLLDNKTGEPISSDGIRITINGEGLNRTVENQAEVYFELSSPGTYEVIPNSPSKYQPDVVYCNDNSKCFATSSVFCGTKVIITQGKIDVWCKYEYLDDVNLSSIDPNSGSVGSAITLRGSGFGTSKGSVSFYNSNGQASGGAPITSWTDIEIKANVPGILAGNSTYQVEVESYYGFKSNRATFTVK